MKKLFEWSLDAGLIDINPVSDVKPVKRPKNGGFKQWTLEEIERFEAHWPIGSRERLALAVLLYTGLRRGDAARLGRQHIKNGIIELRTEKTGTPVIIPVLGSLQRIIDATPITGLTLISTVKGSPMVKESFGNWFKKACKAAGVPGSAHGLRKAGAARAAEEGATVNQLNAIYGWTGTRMASLYTEKADRAKMALEFMSKLENK
jgi:integrase